MNRGETLRIRAVIADLAGTVVDFGSRAPSAVFVELFRDYEVTVTGEEAREPMGLDKRSHVEALLFNPSIAAQWELAHGRQPSTADVDRLYNKFAPLQLEVLRKHCDLVPGVVDAAKEMRRKGIAFAVTTEYERTMMEIILRAMNAADLNPDSALCADDVPEGRPHPWMIFRSMERLGVSPPACVVKIGDTVADIEAGVNAGAWSVGVSETGNLMGLAARDLEHLRENIREERREAAEDRLLEAGAHLTVPSFADLPGAIQTINQRLAKGERPS